MQNCVFLTDYWSKTGLPTLIVERLQAFGKMPSDLGDVETTPSDLDVCDVEELPCVAALPERLPHHQEGELEG